MAAEQELNMDVEKLTFKFNFSNRDISLDNDNEYVSIDKNFSIFIRNFCNSKRHIDIDNYYSFEDIEFINHNVINNARSLNSGIRIEKYAHYSNAILFLSSKQTSRQVVDDNLKIGVNTSLVEYCDQLDIYLCDNPYPSSLNFIPDHAAKWPDGIFSYKILPKFLKMFKGIQMGYNTSQIKDFNYAVNMQNYHAFLEDHRSINLAALNLISNNQQVFLKQVNCCDKN